VNWFDTRLLLRAILSSNSEATPRKASNFLAFSVSDGLAQVSWKQSKERAGSPFEGRKRCFPGVARPMARRGGSAKNPRPTRENWRQRALRRERRGSPRDSPPSGGWWRKTSWDRNNGASDEVADFDARASWSVQGECDPQAKPITCRFDLPRSALLTKATLLQMSH